MKDTLSHWLGLTALLLLVPQTVLAQQPPVSPSPTGEDSAEPALGSQRLLPHFLESPRLLGDPFDSRSWIEERGISLDSYYNHFLGFRISGGKSRSHSGKHSGTLDYLVRLNSRELGLWPGGMLLGHAKTGDGRNINPDIGALSDPIDDADFDEGLYIAQLWYQHAIADGALELRAGYLQSTTIYDRNAFANSEDRQFLATFLDNNPTVPHKLGIGATILVRPARWLELALGVADADAVIRQAGLDTAFDDFESLLIQAEASLILENVTESGSLPGSYRLGTYYDPRRRPVAGRAGLGSGTPGFDRGDAGVYLSLDQMLLRERPGDPQGLGVFVRVGCRDESVHRFAYFGSLGLQYEGPIPGRDRDVLGMGMYQAIASGKFRRRVSRDLSRETGLEVYYRVQATPWLTVSPDFQFIHDPGGLRSARDAIILALRLRMTF